MVKCEGGSEKLVRPHAALTCGHLEAPDGDGGTEAREVAEEEGRKMGPEVGERKQESCRKEKREMSQKKSS